MARTTRGRLAELEDGVERLTRIVSELRSQVEEGSSLARTLQTDWLDFYDKTRRQIERFIKRMDREAELNPPDPAQLSLDPITEKIHRRRNHAVRQIANEG